MIPYPKRDAFFAHKAFRIMHKASVAAVIGRDAMCLVAVILHTEDAARYRGPVRFWNSQLMETLAFAKWDTFNRVRQRAIDAGWLQYTGDGNRSAGEYFVTIPPEYEQIDDGQIEHDCSSVNYQNGYNDGYKAGITDGMRRVQHWVQGGENMGEPYIPIPNPSPNPDPNAARAAAFVYVPGEDVVIPSKLDPAVVVPLAQEWFRHLIRKGFADDVPPPNSEQEQAFWRIAARRGQEWWCETVDGSMSAGWKNLRFESFGKSGGNQHDSTDYESHPEWQEILKILRKWGRDEMTDHQNWRLANMTKAQREARKVAFRRWEELEVYDDRQRKEAAKKYITELNRLISEGVPHK